MTDARPVREKPIIFSGPMVRAILEGRKSQTRRLLKPQPIWESGWEGYNEGCWVYTNRNGYCFPMGEYQHHIQPGDRLWVKENYAHGWPMNPGDVLPPDPRNGQVAITYRADGNVPFGGSGKWRSCIHMPRWASRITLEVTEVRVQRLQDISEADAEAEGVQPRFADGWPSREHIGGFYSIWASIHGLHGPGSWEANPWVAALTFKLANKESSP